jgi:hypothetical protein
VAEDDSKSGVVRGPPRARIRPPWWAVLALSVSLLALVAAATSGHSNPTRGRAAAPDHATNPHESGSTALPPTTTTTTEPAAGPSTVTPPTLPPSSPATTSPTEGVRVVARQTSDTTTTTTTAPTTATTATATTAAAGVSSLAAAVQPVTPITMSGALQQPDDASASYPFTGVGSMEVSASSTSSAPLLLTVTCPAGTVDGAGSSFISVVIPDADGPCELVLKETEVQYDAVPYTVTIGPEGG